MKKKKGPAQPYEGPYRIEIRGTSTGRSPAIVTDSIKYDDGSPFEIADLTVSETRPGFRNPKAGWKKYRDYHQTMATARMFRSAPDMLTLLKQISEGMNAQEASRRAGVVLRDMDEAKITIEKP